MCVFFSILIFISFTTWFLNLGPLDVAQRVLCYGVVRSATGCPAGSLAPTHETSTEISGTPTTTKNRLRKSVPGEQNL